MGLALSLESLSINFNLSGSLRDLADLLMPYMSGFSSQGSEPDLDLRMDLEKRFSGDEALSERSSTREFSVFGDPSLCGEELILIEPFSLSDPEADLDLDLDLDRDLDLDLDLDSDLDLDPDPELDELDPESLKIKIWNYKFIKWMLPTASVWDCFYLTYLIRNQSRKNCFC